jgi:hypothetical protein
MEDVIMKTVKFNAVMASMLGAGALLLSVPVVSNAAPGQGWDAFKSGASNEGVGQVIPESDKPYLGASMEEAPSGGSDAFRSGSSDES